MNIKSIEFHMKNYTIPRLSSRLYKENPKAFPEIKLFGKTRPKFYCLMLTKNSPLTPIFMKAMVKTTEQGILDRIAVSWIGKENC